MDKQSPESQADEGRLTWQRLALLVVTLGAIAAAVYFGIGANPAFEIISNPENAPGPAPKITRFPVEQTTGDVTVVIESVKRVGDRVRITYGCRIAGDDPTSLDRIDLMCARPDTGTGYAAEEKEPPSITPGKTVSQDLVDVPPALRSLDIDAVIQVRPPSDQADASLDVPLPDVGEARPQFLTFVGGRALVNDLLVWRGEGGRNGFVLDLDVTLDRILDEGRAAVFASDPEGNPVTGPGARASISGSMGQHSVRLDVPRLAGTVPPTVRLSIFGPRIMQQHRRLVSFLGVAIEPERRSGR